MKKKIVGMALAVALSLCACTNQETKPPRQHGPLRRTDAASKKISKELTKAVSQEPLKQPTNCSFICKGKRFLTRKGLIVTSGDYSGICPTTEKPTKMPSSAGR